MSEATRVVGVLVSAACAVLVSAALAAAGARPEATREKQTGPQRPLEPAALVAKLGDPDWQVRERAMRDLIALGAPACPALRAALASKDAEVRWRATYALLRLEPGLEAQETDPARELYATAAQARARKDRAGAARLYRDVIKRFPDTRWAAAAREQLAAIDPAATPEAREPVTQERIARLTAQLGAASWRERQEASCRLASLGAAARAALENAVRGPDPEVAWRARQLLERLPGENGPEEANAASREGAPRLEPPADPIREPEPPGVAADLDILVRALGGEDAREVGRAREVLLNVGQVAVGALIRGLDGCNEATGVEIMDLLYQITGQKLGFDAARWRAWWRSLRARPKERG
jgi:hypothetical protein